MPIVRLRDDDGQWAAESPASRVPRHSDEDLTATSTTRGSSTSAGTTTARTTTTTTTGTGTRRRRQMRHRRQRPQFLSKRHNEPRRREGVVLFESQQPNGCTAHLTAGEVADGMPGDDLWPSTGGTTAAATARTTAITCVKSAAHQDTYSTPSRATRPSPRCRSSAARRRRLRLQFPSYPRRRRRRRRRPSAGTLGARAASL